MLDRRCSCFGALLLLAAGCSSDENAHSDAGSLPPDAEVQSPDSGQADASALPDISGAYLLTIETPEPSSEGQLYLLRSSSGAYAALLNGAQCNVEADVDGLTLHSCQLYPPVTVPNQFEVSGAIYSDIRLSRNADGALSETISAMGTRKQRAGTGRLQASTRTPTLRASQLYPRWTIRPSLSWDVIALDFGTGIGLDEQVVRDKLRLSLDSSPASQVQWSYVPSYSIDDAHKVTFGARARLDFAAADGRTARFSLAQDAADVAGHATGAAQELSVPLVQTGEPTHGWSFDADSMPQATWGAPTRVHDSAACAGSCLLLGPRLTACGEPGMAGRLDTRDKTRLIVRARVVLKTPQSLPVRLAIYLDAADDGPKAPTLDANLNERTQPGALMSDWVDLEIDLTPDQRRGDLPFELRAIYECPWSWTTTPVPAPSTDASILIDAIALE